MFNKKNLFIVFVAFLLLISLVSCPDVNNSSGGSSGTSENESSDTEISDSRIINHNCINLDLVPTTQINNAKNTLHIAYAHTSHGNQIIVGMNGLDVFKGGTGLYVWNDGPLAGHLDLDNNFAPGDLGNPDRVTWAQETRDYLDLPANSDVNVVIWSWCGQADGTETEINTYLNLMAQLEIDYPSVTFVYMTGHLNGDGLSGNLHLRNEQIREYCRNNNKWLFDFADIESYNPDGDFFGNKLPDDNCDYDSDGVAPRTETGNWATEWQNANPGEWYDCSPDHTQPLNGNLKAYAAWWLWARIAGWNP